MAAVATPFESPAVVGVKSKDVNYDTFRNPRPVSLSLDSTTRRRRCEPLFPTTAFRFCGRGRRRLLRRPFAFSPTASLGGLLGGIFKGADTGESTRQQYSSTVSLVNGFEAEMSTLSDSQLREKTEVLKERARRGDSLDSLLPETFAVVREASKRVLGLRPFDVQLIGGMVLHKGEIAEMRTGEGKTLVAILPAYLNALTGKGVHVVTVNDYLARRDCEWVGQVPRFLGMKVGLIQQC
ncbi:hypothetical protein CsSME_00047571 [Camellia sinensis var. sinensis]